MDDKRRDRLVAAFCIGLFAAANLILFALGRFPVREAGVPDWTTTLGLTAAAALTFAIYSFLYDDNPFFRAAENLMVGLGVGISFYMIWYQFLKPDVYDRYVDPFFNPAATVQSSDLVLIIPLFLGALVLTRVSRKHGWVSRYPIAMLIGYGAGFAIQPTVHSLILKQVEKSIPPIQMPWVAWAACGAVAAAVIAGALLASKGGRLATALKVAACVLVAAYLILRTTPRLTAMEAVEQSFRGVDLLLIVVGVICVLCYFFFSAEHKGAVGAVARLGTVFLMVSFGASFGYTVMARESLVIGRFQFLLGDWLGLLPH
jgi:hypothetical protein